MQVVKDDWVQTQTADGSWQFSIFVLEDLPDRKRLCIGDQALNGGTYRSWLAIDVSPSGNGQWRATGTAQDVTGCAR